MVRKILIVGAASFGLLLSGCDSAEILAQQDGINPPDVTPTDPSDSDESTTELVDIIATDADNINTVFAPTDSAFEALGADAVAALMADSATLSDTLLYHVLAGSNESSDLVEFAGATITMSNGSEAAITLDDEGILLINGIEITATDIAASNGTIHAIGTVLTPPGGAADPTTEPTGNIAQLLSDDPQFSTLLDAVTATGLDATLAGDGDFTLFAPTNEAFSAVDEDSLNALLADPDALRDVLLNHIIDGDAIDSIAAIAADGTALVSAAGGPLVVTLARDDLLVRQ